MDRRGAAAREIALEPGWYDDDCSNAARADRLIGCVVAIQVLCDVEESAGRQRIDQLAAVLRDYPDTPFADKARAEVGEMAGKPPVPPQPLAWLVNLFPDSDTAKPLVATAASETTTR